MSLVLPLPAAKHRASAWFIALWPAALFVVAFVVGTVARIIPSLGLPLWLDETFTATIATQPDVMHLIRWCLNEVTGPAFYVPMWLWTHLAGSSDLALRLPPLTMALATPLVAARYGAGDRRLALAWGALCALWLPALPDAFEARAYPQLFLLGVGQAIAFNAAMRAPRTTALLGWSAATSAMVLTHYYALAIGGVQGAMLLARHPRPLLRCWPALGVLALAGAWLALHLAFLVDFAGNHAAHYAPLAWPMLATVPMMAFGVGIHGYVVTALVGWTAIADRHARIAPSAPADRLLALSGLAGFAAIVAAGFWQASFAPRYLTPVMPALLFGLASWANRQAARRPIAVAAVLGSMLLAMVATLIAGSPDGRFDERRSKSLAAASAWLAERRPDRLYFAWPSATGKASASANLADMAGFPFRRAGLATRVIVVRGADPNRALPVAAGGDPHGALLWFADDPLSAGLRPHSGRDDPRWDCRDFSRGVATVYACRR